MVSPQLQRVVLTGFMGSGKTTVGRLLAARLGWVFADLDDTIAERCRMSVPDIFALLGEPSFRREESLALAECLTHRHLVIALGGGAAETEFNRTLLQNAANSAIVYLQGDFAALHARCLLQAAADPTATARPVMVDPEHARQRFLRRVPLYREIATHTVVVSHRSAAEIAAALAKELHAQDTRETP